MRKYLPLLGLWVGCTGGQTGTPVSVERPPDAGACMSTADSATALGLTSTDLLTLYGGSYPLELKRRARQSDFSTPTDVELRIAPSDTYDPRTLACDKVAVAIEVTVTGPEIAERGTGVLYGTLESAQVDVDFVDSAERGPGSIRFNGTELHVYFQFDEFVWTTEDP
jgi:hypothetical protein